MQPGADCKPSKAYVKKTDLHSVSRLPSITLCDTGVQCALILYDVMLMSSSATVD